MNFSSLVNSFYENELSPQIGVQIDRTILRDLEVSVFGGITNKDCYNQYMQ